MNRNLHSTYSYLSLMVICILVIGIYFSNETTANKEIKEHTSYTLGEFYGYLAVYSGENTQPDKIFDVNISTFPPADITAIKQGITVYSREELYRLIEDFT